MSFSSDDESDTKAKAAKRIREELESDSELSEQSDSDDSSSSAVKVDFSTQQSKVAKKKDKGIMGLKFMQKAEQRKQEALKV